MLNETEDLFFMKKSLSIEENVASLTLLFLQTAIAGRFSNFSGLWSTPESDVRL